WTTKPEEAKNFDELKTVIATSQDGCEGNHRAVTKAYQPELERVDAKLHELLLALLEAQTDVEIVSANSELFRLGCKLHAQRCFSAARRKHASRHAGKEVHPPRR